MSQTSRTWAAAARDQLRQLRRDGVGWGYRQNGPAYTEPTVLGCLALLGSHDEPHDEDVDEMVQASADWLADIQQPDGAVGVSEELPKPRWATAFAALLWSQLSTHSDPLARSLRWLQQREGHTFLKTKECVLGHDTSIPGWPWVAGTHPWLEPTGFAMLALCSNQLAGHQRIRDGVRMILDRSVASGGWNMGNSTVFGRSLRPQVGPTGIALLALRAALHEEADSVNRACDFLSEALQRTRAPESLGWGLLGLAAWRPRPSEASDWLQQAFESSPALAKSPVRLSMLLMAASRSTPVRLGVRSIWNDETLVGSPTP